MQTGTRPKAALSFAFEWRGFLQTQNYRNAGVSRELVYAPLLVSLVMLTRIAQSSSHHKEMKALLAQKEEINS
jgi:hypothetical protein